MSSPLDFITWSSSGKKKLSDYLGKNNISYGTPWTTLTTQFYIKENDEKVSLGLPKAVSLDPLGFYYNPSLLS